MQIPTNYSLTLLGQTQSFHVKIDNKLFCYVQLQNKLIIVLFYIACRAQYEDAPVVVDGNLVSNYYTF